MASSPSQRGHSVLAVANEFIALSKKDGTRLTPMHIQKLCYYAQGFNLAYADKPITYDQVEAWDWGPVFPTLYNALKKYGAGQVSESIRANNWATSESVRGNIVSDVFSPDESRLIRDVFDTYAGFEPFQLSALTHEAGSPWEKTYQSGIKGVVIPVNLIKDYFVELAAA